MRPDLLSARLFAASIISARESPLLGANPNFELMSAMNDSLMFRKTACDGGRRARRPRIVFFSAARGLGTRTSLSLAIRVVPLRVPQGGSKALEGANWEKTRHADVEDWASGRGIASRSLGMERGPDGGDWAPSFAAAIISSSSHYTLTNK